jgi:oligoendopeptidase F
MLNTSSKIHKFKDYVGATAFSDEIDEKLITKLYKNTEQYKTSFIKYRNTVNKLLKKQLKISQLEPWDKTVDLNKKEIKFTIEETKGIILNAFKPLGVEYVKNIQTAFNERWISWMPKPGKQQGAYSIDGTKGLSKYYISMNFDNSIRSVSTIAHELGHSMNSLYINKKQDIYTDVSIFYAEIASITNEMLLSYYLLDKYRNDFEMSKMILDEMINNFFATVSRQIIFSNTEYLLNEYVNESKPFTKEAVKQIYLTMIDKYQGIAQDMKNKIHQEPYSFSQSTILRIPHFYAGNFYVYKYAIGQIVAINVAYKIHKGDKNTISKYFDFLSSGSSLSPLDTIKLLGVDLNDNQVYSETKKIIDQ